MKIEIAGAGAGKTTSLSKKIIKRYNENNEENIFCVSFTNSSVKVIKEKLDEYFGCIPENIKVMTIHSFLHSQFIYPYYFLLYDKQFRRITSNQLDTNPGYARSTVTRLESKDILHVSEITKKAKYLICGKSTDKKLIKNRRIEILRIIEQSYDAVFIDEAQDIDKYFSEVLIKLNQLDIYIELVGDPKQDLKGNGILSQLLKDFKDEVSYIEGSYRCPEKHLSISNRYVPKEQSQKAMTNKDGEIKFYFSSNIPDIDSFITNKGYDLVYIYQKKDIFNTNIENKKNCLFEEVEQVITQKIIQNMGNVDENHISLLSSRICCHLVKEVNTKNKTPAAAVSRVFKSIQLSKQEYAILVNALKKEIEVSISTGILVDSISRIKGKQGEKCLFIISNALMPYLLEEKNYNDSIKMQSHLYVGLTRSSKYLDLLFIEEVEKKYSKEELEKVIVSILE